MILKMKIMLMNSNNQLIEIIENLIIMGTIITLTRLIKKETIIIPISRIQDLIITIIIEITVIIIETIIIPIILESINQIIKVKKNLKL
jgi:hypothetical protein